MTTYCLFNQLWHIASDMLGNNCVLTMCGSTSKYEAIHDLKTTPVPVCPECASRNLLRQRRLDLEATS